jgi:hypothetical protein
MSSIFIFLGSNPKNREKASDRPEKGRKLAVRGLNDKHNIFAKRYGNEQS